MDWFVFPVMDWLALPVIDWFVFPVDCDCTLSVCSVFPVDEGECSYKSAEKVVFTVYPVKNGKFTARYFNDDGESFEYLKNNCVKLEFDVNCDNENVDVVVNNMGNVKFEPEIKLVSTDLRKLNVSVK